MKYYGLLKKGSTTEYDFSGADKIYDFAVSNNIPIRGHTLAWHFWMPEDLFGPMTYDEVFAFITNHIDILAKRYPKIYCWDVVNEALNDGDGYLRDTIWKRKLGDDYLHTIHNLAREKMPRTALIYNDYNEVYQGKRGRIIRLVNEIRERGTPIDGIGLQCHISVHQPSVDNYERCLDELAALGLPLQITEMDVSVYKHGEKPEEAEKPYDAETEKQLAKVYGEYFKLFRKYKDHIDAVTFWGVADDCTWLDHFPVNNRKNYPLLFDVNHEPKEAFYAVMDF
jgi:endo-1,4-beta-xylanase